MDRTGNRHCMASVYKIFWYSLSLRKASPPTAGTCCVVLVFVGGLCDESTILSYGEGERLFAEETK
jgi:FtsH-binding integral membrane protein